MDRCLTRGEIMFPRPCLPAIAVAIAATHASTFASDLPRAIATGDHRHVGTAVEIHDAIQQRLDSIQRTQSYFTKKIFGTTAINYAPGQSSQIFNILDFDKSWPLLTGNKGRILAVNGRDGYGIFSAWGANVPDRVQRGEMGSAMSAAFGNLLAYVLKTTPEGLAAPRTVTLAFMSGSELSNTRTWLQNRYPSWTIVTCNDPLTLNVCLMGSSLVLGSDSVSDANAPLASATLQAAVKKGKALVYLHNRWSTNAFSSLTSQWMKVEMPYAGNWFSQDSAVWANSTAMLAPDSVLKQIGRTVSHLNRNDFPAFDWSQCTSSVGTTSCDNVPGLSAEFLQGAGAIRSAVMSDEQNGKSLFRLSGNTLLKLLVLLGDKYRQESRYPLDKNSGLPFFKALYADHANAYLRWTNPPPADLGTFADALPSGTPLVSRDITLDLGTSSYNRSTGLYAVPGMPLRIFRLDSGTGTIGAYLNSIRPGSTRAWNTNGLARPKFLQSSVIPVTQTTQIMTTPYGGPVYLSVPPGSGQAKVRIVGAATYPHLNGLGNQTAIQAFASALDTTVFDWAGIRTDFVDINSRTNMLRQSINAAPYHGDVSKTLGDVWTYMIRGTYELAGFSGSGLSLAAGVQSRCTALGWDCTSPAIHARPPVQHITVDTMANCGSGCSGNPYDQDWALSPIGWGETHEIGHNLQRGRLKIHAGKSTEVSNNVFPSYKGWQYFQATGIKADHCSRGNDAKVYGWLQEAHNSADPRTSMYNRLWAQTGIYDNAFERLSFYLQMAYSANGLPGLGSGWEIHTLMYLHERLFSDAIKDANRWADARSRLGFGNYASAPTGIDGNDFMLISYSYLTGKDQRPYFDAWGVGYSETAGQQVAAYGFEPVAPRYYHATEHCSSLAVPSYPIDGVSSLP